MAYVPKYISKRIGPGGKAVYTYTATTGKSTATRTYNMRGTAAGGRTALGQGGSVKSTRIYRHKNGITEGSLVLRDGGTGLRKLFSAESWKRTYKNVTPSSVRRFNRLASAIGVEPSRRGYH